MFTIQPDGPKGSRKTMYDSFSPVRWIRERRSNASFQIIVGAAFGAVLIGGVTLATYQARWSFAASVAPGMPMQEVRDRAGEPSQVFQSGETPDTWGNGPEQPVAEEAWVYLLFPSHANRAMITFENGRVAKVEFRYN